MGREGVGSWGTAVVAVLLLPPGRDLSFASGSFGLIPTLGSQDMYAVQWTLCLVADTPQSQILESGLPVSWVAGSL